jgi:hypothetical protein
MRRVARVILVLLAIFLACILFPLLINLTSDSSRENAPARQVFSGDQDLADPTVKPTLRPSATVPPRRALELAEAIKEGLVKIEAIGQVLESLELILDSLSDEDLIVEVKPGTLFKPASASTQTMVVRAAQQVSLDAGGHAETQLDVACANMHLDGLTSADVFNIELDISLFDLIDLLELAEFSQEDFRLQQFSIWTITDNPSRNRYVGLG